MVIFYSQQRQCGGVSLNSWRNDQTHCQTALPKPMWATKSPYWRSPQISPPPAAEDPVHAAHHRLQSALNSPGSSASSYSSTSSSSAHSPEEIRQVAYYSQYATSRTSTTKDQSSTSLDHSESSAVQELRGLYSPALDPQLLKHYEAKKVSI